MTDKQKLNQKLWDIANDLRGKMGADEFRDYILGFIFYKYLSEKMLRYANKILEPDNMAYHDINLNTKEGQRYLEAVKENSIDDLGYFLEPGELFSTMVMRGNGNGKANFILDDLQTVLIEIEQSTMGTDSEEDFENLFEDLDLDSSKLGKTPEDRNEIIVKVMEKLDEIDFKLDDSENDVLGDAYEYLIGKFASGAGKKAGEFYTPQEVSSVLAKLVTVDKERLKNVYDPTCGSGSLLLRVAREVKEVGEFFGQESNPTTYNLCRMNMIMHDVHYSRFDIKNEDTLERPQHIDKKFEAVVANPPFSAKWSADPLKMNDDRFSAYGKLAPKSRADFAFVQHMIYQLEDNGAMVCVLPLGVLFRSGREEIIRKHLINEMNYLDAIIGLPENIFYGTEIPTSILVFRKLRTNPEHILFINSSNYYEKVNTKNRLRDKDIDKILNTYKRFRSGNWESNYTGVLEEKYSYITNRKEIIENDYNLNLPRYVDTYEGEDPVNLNNVCENLHSKKSQFHKHDEEIIETCKKLSISPPEGYNLNLLKKYKKGVLQKIFNREVRFKKSDGSNFSDWEELLGKHLFKTHSNKDHDGTLPVLSATQESGMVLRDDVGIDIKYNKDNLDTYKIVEKGDFVISLRSFQGGIELSEIKGICSPAYIILKSKKNIDSQFYKFYFKKEDFINRLAQTVVGIRDGKQISYSAFSGVKIFYPEIEEQRIISRFLNLIQDKIDLIEYN